MGLILDTSALIALERPKLGPDAVSLDPEEIYALPAIVWAEARSASGWQRPLPLPPVVWRVWKLSGELRESRNLRTL